MKRTGLAITGTHTQEIGPRCPSHSGRPVAYTGEVCYACKIISAQVPYIRRPHIDWGVVIEFIISIGLMILVVGGLGAMAWQIWKTWH